LEFFGRVEAGNRGAVLADLLVQVFGRSAGRKILIARFIVQTGKLLRNRPCAPIWYAYSQIMCKNGGALAGNAWEMEKAVTLVML
jgi:hypothetical protein